MSGASRLEGCPWHTEKLLKQDERRHSHNCKHFSIGKCINSNSVYYELKCGGSAHCSNYKKLSEEKKPKKSVNKKDDESYWFD